jgi:acyl carrier protein
MDDIINKLSDIKEIKPGEITMKSNLILDLYCDSLDLAEIKSYILNNYKKSNDIPLLDLKTVSDLVLMAM